MGQTITLKASDGFELSAYRADPATPAKAAVVVIQEIFGVNDHIRTVCDRFTVQGYTAIAPAIFDRVEPNFQSGYSPEEVAVARKFVANPDFDAFLRDTQAAIDAVKSIGPVGVIGFCLGGSIAFAAATRLSGITAAIGYYGGAIARFADETPKVPTLLHYGEKDQGIPAVGCRGGAGPASGRRDLRLSRRPARLQLRPARELRQAERRPRPPAQPGVFCEASVGVRRRPCRHIGRCMRPRGLSPHPEERRSRVSKDEARAPRPHGSRRAALPRSSPG